MSIDLFGGEAAPEALRPPSARLKYNREGWLTELSRMLQPTFRGFGLPAFRVTCGWPASNAFGGTIGQCFGPESSSGKTFELFISPLLAAPVEVGGTLCHEMAHVAAGMKAAHGKGFVKVCRHVGLTAGRPKQASPGPALADHIAALADRLGPYPHARMQPKCKRIERARSSTLVVCPRCECRFSIGLKWLKASGMPTCGCGEPMQLAEPEGE